MSQEEFMTLKSGAVRTTDAEDERWDLIPPEALQRLAGRFAVGAAKYGDRNWEKGMESSMLFRHLMRHLWLWWSGDKSDDHLSAAIWNITALIHFENTEFDDRQKGGGENAVS